MCGCVGALGVWGHLRVRALEVDACVGVWGHLG